MKLLFVFLLVMPFVLIILALIVLSFAKRAAREIDGRQRIGGTPVE